MILKMMVRKNPDDIRINQTVCRCFKCNFIDSLYEIFHQRRDEASWWKTNEMSETATSQNESKKHQSQQNGCLISPSFSPLFNITLASLHSNLHHPPLDLKSFKIYQGLTWEWRMQCSSNRPLSYRTFTRQYHLQPNHTSYVVSHVALNERVGSCNGCSVLWEV